DRPPGGALMVGGYSAIRRVPAFSSRRPWRCSWCKQRAPHTVAIPRGWGSASLDVLRHNVVLTGGNGDTIRTDNTWTWDGVDWTWVTPATQVPRFVGAGSAFDPGARDVVLFGGFSDSGLGETWSWSEGTDWAP